ncbi:hypothetical protein AAGF08_09770 [Algoriphagus sp. SE2]|uniref:hypothetical protein n=1 Tax=Algoriphagus sp. SE2 TaxID=3141536 RepID=UPI0031CD8971
MINHLLRLLFILPFLWVFSQAAMAQDKMERELRIKEIEVPKEAKEWISDTFETTKRLKWYQEIYESGYSFEAKFKSKGKFYSVEFDSLGLIQDVEIEIDFKEIPRDVRTGLEKELSPDYKKSDIKRLQIQYSGASEDLKDFFHKNSFKRILTRYEIEYIGLDEKGVSEFWEGLFSDEGKLIRKRKIVVTPSENLVF